MHDFKGFLTFVTKELDKWCVPCRKNGENRDTIDTLHSFKYNDIEIKEAVIKQYGLSEKEIEEYL